MGPKGTREAGRMKKLARYFRSVLYFLLPASLLSYYREPRASISHLPSVSFRPWVRLNRKSGVFHFLPERRGGTASFSSHTLDRPPPPPPPPGSIFSTFLCLQKKGKTEMKSFPTSLPLYRYLSNFSRSPMPIAEITFFFCSAFSFVPPPTESKTRI